jgi:hypothetical protein
VESPPPAQVDPGDDELRDLGDGVAVVLVTHRFVHHGPYFVDHP